MYCTCDRFRYNNVPVRTQDDNHIYQLYIHALLEFVVLAFQEREKTLSIACRRQ